MSIAHNYPPSISDRSFVRDHSLVDVGEAESTRGAVISPITVVVAKVSCSASLITYLVGEGVVRTRHLSRAVVEIRGTLVTSIPCFLEVQDLVRLLGVKIFRNAAVVLKQPPGSSWPCDSGLVGIRVSII